MIKVDIDLRRKFGPVRDQGARPTCLAFAASDTHSAVRGTWQALSCEYIFYHAQRRRGSPFDQGSYLDDMLLSVQEQGQPVEEDWPYLNNLPSDLSEYAPPTEIREVFFRKSKKVTGKVDCIVELLNRGHPVIVLSVLTMSFFRPPPNGIIFHNDGEEVFPTPRHAVIAVGHGTSGSDRFILIRNSWGPTWCQGGYAWLSEAYLNKHMYDMAILTEECDVSHHSAAA